MVTARAEPPGLAAAVEAALRKRLTDWRRSASEVYAGEEQWQNGLIGYLMRGPGSVTDALAAHAPEPREAQGEAGDGLAAVIAEWLRENLTYDSFQSDPDDVLAEGIARAVRTHLGLTPGGGAG